MSCGDSWNSSKFGKLSDFSTYIWTRDIYVKWRNLKFVYMWRNSRFFTSVMFWNLELRKSNYYFEPWLFFIQGRAGRRAPLRFCRENLFMRKLPAAELRYYCPTFNIYLQAYFDDTSLFDAVQNSTFILRHILMLMLIRLLLLSWRYYCSTFNIYLKTYFDADADADVAVLSNIQ